MRKSLLFILCLSLFGCGAYQARGKNWDIPYGKTQSDFYNDLNSCIAEANKVQNEFIAQAIYRDNCMRGRGYTIAK